MTTKDFLQMTTAKLEALVKTASDKDRAIISAILRGRQKAQETEMTKPAEPAEVSEKAETRGRKPAPRLSDAELDELIKELKRTAVGHRCQAVPFNSTDWESGVIVGAIPEKKTNKAILAIRLDDERRIVKVSDSPLLKILDETVEKITLKTVPRREWTQEQLNAEIARAGLNIGKIADVKSGGETYTGRITALVTDRRVQRIVYKVEVPAATGEDPYGVKVFHRMNTSEDITIREGLDEVGQRLNDKFTVRYRKSLAKVSVTPEVRVQLIRKAMENAEAKIAKWQQVLENHKKELAVAEQALEKVLAERAKTIGADAPEPKQEETEPEGLS